MFSEVQNPSPVQLDQVFPSCVLSSQRGLILKEILRAVRTYVKEGKQTGNVLQKQAFDI